MTRAENPPAYLERLRDEFAMAALQGMCASIPSDKWADRTNGVTGFKYMSQAAYDAADALLTARQGGGHE